MAKKCDGCGETDGESTTFWTAYGRGICINGFAECTLVLCDDCDSDKTEVCEECDRLVDSEWGCLICSGQFSEKEMKQ